MKKGLLYLAIGAIALAIIVFAEPKPPIGLINLLAEPKPPIG